MRQDGSTEQRVYLVGPLGFVAMRAPFVCAAKSATLEASNGGGRSANYLIYLSFLLLVGVVTENYMDALRLLNR